LLAGLDYLASRRLDRGMLPDIPILIVHGGRDLIAPEEEARGLFEGASNATFCLEADAGHACFVPGLIDIASLTAYNITNH
jgi:pimeloyl-ACP methyl ester carboxylesterase